jgi:hypothetical protein
VRKNTETLTDASNGIELEVNTKKTKFMLPSRHQNAEQNYNIKTVNKSSEKFLRECGDSKKCMCGRQGRNIGV